MTTRPVFWLHHLLLLTMNLHKSHNFVVLKTPDFDAEVVVLSSPRPGATFNFVLFSPLSGCVRGATRRDARQNATWSFRFHVVVVVRRRLRGQTSLETICPAPSTPQTDDRLDVTAGRQPRAVGFADGMATAMLNRQRASPRPAKHAASARPWNKFIFHLGRCPSFSTPLAIGWLRSLSGAGRAVVEWSIDRYWWRGRNSSSSSCWATYGLTDPGLNSSTVNTSRPALQSRPCND